MRANQPPCSLDAIGQGKDGFLTLQDRPLLATIVNAIKELARRVTDLADTVAGFADKFTTKELVAINVTATRGTFDQLCVKDDAGVPVCVTGTQLRSLLNGSVLSASSQSAAGTSPTVGTDTEAPGGSSALEASDADTATTTTPAEATSTPEAANDNEPVGEMMDTEPEPDEGEEPAPTPELEASNDNQPAEPLPATGTE